jgi:chromate transporter
MADQVNRNMQAAPATSLREASHAFGRIGLLSFGGPAAQIAVMHRILVEERRWLSEGQFLHALNFCMLLPGPEAMQLATYSGWLMHGVRGGLIAGLLFILPGLAMMLALSAVFVVYGDLPAVAGLLYGLKAAVLAVVAAAMIKLAGKTLKTPFMTGLAVLAFVLIAFVKAPFPLIVIGAGFTGALLARFAPAAIGRTGNAADPDVLPDAGRRAGSAAAMSAAAWLAIWLVPLTAIVALSKPGSFFGDAALFFSKTAVVTFGGAYAVLAYVGQQAVELYGWLKPDEMLAGLGLAETTLGPLVLVLVFVGFTGGSRVAGFDPLTGGLLGGLLAAFFTFIPCFLWIFAGAPFVETLRHVRWLAAGLQAITAAVVGVIANLALWFGLHVLFGPPDEYVLGPFRLPVVDAWALDFGALAIAVLAGIALIRSKVSIMFVLAVSAAAGLVLRGL